MHSVNSYTAQINATANPYLNFFYFLNHAKNHFISQTCVNVIFLHAYKYTHTLEISVYTLVRRTFIVCTELDSEEVS